MRGARKFSSPYSIFKKKILTSDSVFSSVSGMYFSFLFTSYLSIHIVLQLHYTTTVYFVLKKQSSISMLSVFPNLRGRVIRVTSSLLSHQSFINSVLSMKKHLFSLILLKLCIPTPTVLFIASAPFKFIPIFFILI